MFGEIEMAVKMRPSDRRTKRPHEALLQLDTEIFKKVVENRRELTSVSISGIPLAFLERSNPRFLQTKSETLLGG